VYMIRRSFLSGAGLLAATALLPGCDFKPNGSKNGKATIRVAQWGQEKYLIYLPFYIAQEAGFFETQGLDVNLSYSGNDDQVFASVLRADAQFGIGDPIFSAISRNRGGDGVVVGQVVDRVALWGVAKQGAKRRDTPADFANTRVGTFPRPSTTYSLMREMFDREKVNGARIIEVPIGSEVALLESNEADVVMMLEPAASNAVEAGYEIVTSLPKLWGSFAFTGMSAVKAYTDQNPEIVDKVRAAMQSALNLAHQKSPEAISIAQRLFGSMDKDVVEAAVRRMLADQTIPRQFAVSPEGWQAAVRVRQAMGELKSGDYTSVVI
jgi:NitT/TauT family transport system substrate-binding protein